MGLENLGNNLNSVRLLLLGHYQNHHKFEKEHLGVAFLVLFWIFHACIYVDCGFFKVQTGI
jgi:hypothetical protein